MTDDDIITTRDQYGLDHDLSDVRFYWGVASGGTHAALSRAVDDDSLPDPDHLMVSWMTAMNGVWEGPAWFIDSGGAPDTIKANGGHPKPISDHLDYLETPPTKYGSDPEDVQIDRFALRDWPCEPAVRDELGLTVEELQQKTLDDHIRMLEAADGRDIDARPVAVLQGWTPDDYLDCLDLFRDHGLVTDAIGLGSVCRRGGLDDIQDIAHRVRRNLPPRVDLHGFGLKQSMLEQPDALDVFDSVDSAAWENTLRQATRDGIDKAPPQPDLTYQDWDDWDDRGNPRYTFGNVQTCFDGYAAKVNGIRASNGKDARIVDLADWPAVIDRLDGDGTDGYPLLKCVCGTIVDPGRPDPGPDVGCRHCQMAAVNIWDRHVAHRDQTLHGDYPDTDLPTP
jgi:hypothetical protein